jgi:hypothetical protein
MALRLNGALDRNYSRFWLLMTKAAITPGTQPIRVRMVVITIEPQPLSNTARGGKIIHTITRQMLIVHPLFASLIQLGNRRKVFRQKPSFIPPITRAIRRCVYRNLSNNFRRIAYDYNGFQLKKSPLV